MAAGDHFLQQVVDGIVAKLTTPSVITGLADASRVTAEDDYPREEALVPLVNVLARGFQREGRTLAGANGRPEATNLCDIRVQCVAKGQQSGKRAAIALAKEVEKRWLGTTADEQLVGIVSPPIRRATCVDLDVRTDTDGDGAYAVAEMTFQVKVLSIEGRPDLS